MGSHVSSSNTKTVDGESRGATAAAPLVLVVDDIEDNRDMYVRQLDFAGLRVAEASNAHDAIRIAREERPAVIVMDLSMPDLDGWEATRILKSDPELASIAIVALSAFNEPASRRRARECGADFFVSKPCIPSELLLHVTECLRRRPKPRAT